MKIHFYLAGCLRNTQIAIYAIDNLRQLSIRFIQKEELENYQYQKEFLQPFELIFREDNVDEETREFILDCIYMIVVKNKKDLKSGWKTIANIINLTVTRDDNHHL